MINHSVYNSKNPYSESPDGRLAPFRLASRREFGVRTYIHFNSVITRGFWLMVVVTKT